ncbi:MAG: ABC transporter substrate-binding protein [Solirubrobacteraceae bacterium]|nr:ABC transporter substrate-binding protein [Solirubrobacteraceae bacterium]
MPPASRALVGGCRRPTAAVVAAVCLTLLAPAMLQAKPPKRVVALTPFSANTMASLGLRPIAVGQAPSGGPSLYHPNLASTRRLPLSHPAGPNLEQLSSLRTDFVFTTDAWSRGTAGMKRLKIRVGNREPKTVADVPRQTQRIAKIMGKRSTGKRLAAAQRRAIAQASKNIKRRPKVLMVLGVGSTTYAFLPNSWGGDVVRRAGGALITGGLKASTGYARISDEFVVARNPDVIIAVPHGNPSDIDRIARNLGKRPGWRSTKAARNKRVYVSTSNTLLQPIVGVASTITSVRRSYLRN